MVQKIKKEKGKGKIVKYKYKKWKKKISKKAYRTKMTRSNTIINGR